MNKHQTLTYLKYGKLINKITKINNNITNHTFIVDMIKFLENFPETLKHPDLIQLTNIEAIFIYYIINTPQIRPHIQIRFDGKNNFKLYMWGIIDMEPKFNEKINNWISINDVEHYVNMHLTDFVDIIEKK